MKGFEFDHGKSRSNQDKHGISFPQALNLWDDECLLEIPARTDDEPRWLVIGKIDDLHWSAVITRRNNRTRIISVRRSRRNEITWYESENV